MTEAARKEFAAALRPTKRKRNYVEDRLQVSIVSRLRLVLKDSIVFAIPNGAHCGEREGKRLKDAGLLAGVPDLAIVGRGGRVFFIEVKAPKGTLSDAQDALNSWFLANAVPYAVVRSIDDTMTAIGHWGLNTREAA